jgi:hypothetical protein
MPDVWRGNKKCGTACGYCFAIPAGTSEHTSKRTIHLRYLLVQVVREHQPADHTHDTATQTDDEHFPSPGTVSEIISRTVQEQIATLANLLRSTQEQSEAMAERCRTLEERQSQVQLQDVRFSSAPPASDRVRFVNAVAYRVRKLLLQHRRRTAQWEPELSWITRLTQQERKAQIIARPIWWAKRCDEKLDGASWRLKPLDTDRLDSLVGVSPSWFNSLDLVCTVFRVYCRILLGCIWSGHLLALSLTLNLRDGDDRERENIYIWIYIYYNYI